MKFKLLCLSSLLIMACSNTEDSISDAKNSATNNDNQQDVVAQAPAAHDSLFPYFDFAENGERIHYVTDASKALAKSGIGRSALTIDSEDDFIKMEEEYATRLATDFEYSHRIERPLDYVCRTSLLAMNQDFSAIVTAAGDTLLNDRILKENCEYIGYDCVKLRCDDSAEEDPYLDALKVLKREEAENEDLDQDVTVEIYPYRMQASAFMSILGGGGAETYFKKRQRVWRGTSGMVWRWADFDPDRNGVRAYCYNGCNNNGGRLVCGWRDSNSDLDTCCDTEDITVRCGFDHSSSWYNGFSKAEADELKRKLIGSKGVVGMHYVRHGENYFYAMTSANFSSEMKSLLRYNTYNLNGDHYTYSYR